MRINTNRLNKIRYTLYAPGYDLVARILDRFRSESIRNTNIQPTDKVLIVGAGTGLDLEYIPVGCDITAVDLTPAMITQIEKRNRTLKHHLTTFVMDGHHLKFDSNQFDVVILHLILSVIPYPDQCLKETERVIKPEGRIAIFDKFVASGMKPSWIRRLFNPLTNLLFSNITRSFEPILIETNLELKSDNPAFGNGFFRMIQLIKK